ncbi:MAG TPA: RNA polymerase subunit sigma-24 [Geobacter sp.]|nr:RNA polymerase subunit sigma-24 [Geobacter sp.]
MKDFESIYHEFHPRISRYIGKLLSDDAAPDVTQAVFLKVSKSLDTLRDEASLSAWIYRIATNLAHDYATSSLATQKRSELLLDEESSIDDFPDEDRQGTESEYIRREMNACIRGVVEELPKNYRTVLILNDFEELSNAEIAEVLDLSVETVKIRLHRGRAALRSAMTCQCELYHDDRNELMCDRKG